MVNICNPQNKCNTCKECCTPNIKNQTDCDTCVIRNCSSFQDTEQKGTYIFIIIAIIQIIILIGLAIRKKINEQKNIKKSLKVSADNISKKQKYINIIWFLIGLGIILSVFLYLFLKDDRKGDGKGKSLEKFHISIDFPLGNNNNKISKNYTLIADNIFKGELYKNENNDPVIDSNNEFIYWYIMYKEKKKGSVFSKISSTGDQYTINEFPTKSQFFTTYQTYVSDETYTILYSFQYTNIPGQLEMFIYNQADQTSVVQPAINIFIDKCWSSTGSTDFPKYSNLIDIRNINNSIYFLSATSLYNFNFIVNQGIENDGKGWANTKNWLKCGVTSETTFNNCIAMANYDNYIYILDNDIYGYTIYKLDATKLNNLQQFTIDINDNTINPLFIATENMLLLFTNIHTYYINTQTGKYIESRSLNTIINTKFAPIDYYVVITNNSKCLLINNIILIITQDLIIQFDPVTQDVNIDFSLPFKVNPQSFVISDNYLFYLNIDTENKTNKLNVYQITQPQDFEPYGWIIAPLNSKYDIYTSNFEPIVYFSSNSQGALCTNTKIWCMNIVENNITNCSPVQINISGDACVHFSKSPTDFKPSSYNKNDKESLIEFDKPKFVFTGILVIQLLILLIIGCRKYLQLDSTKYFFNKKFIILLIFCVGISISSYTEITKLTAEHILRIIIGLQICILSFLAIRKYNNISKQSIKV